ncbi:Nucleotide-binding protein, partial [Clarias magur]
YFCNVVPKSEWLPKPDWTPQERGLIGPPQSPIRFHFLAQHRGRIFCKIHHKYI